MASCFMSKPDDTEKTFLDEDPVSYDDGPAERRVSSHATFGGSRVWQDFGPKEVDRQIRLRTDWMTQSTLDAFESKFAQVGIVWKWVDHKAHEYRVFFRALNPERIRGHDAYRVEILLDVVQVVI